MRIGAIANLDTDEFVSSVWLDVHDQYSVSSSPAVRHSEVPPNYRIVPSLRNPKIEPGDTIELDLFISGYGMPELSRLTIFGSVENIFEIKEDSIRVIPNVSGAVEDGDVNELVRGPPAKSLGLVDEQSFEGFPVSTPIPPVVFVDDPGIPGDEKSYAPHSYPNVVGEAFVFDGASLRIEIDTKGAEWYSSSWYSGEYPIQFVLLYGDETNMKITKEDIPVKVRTRGDKFWWLTAIIALAAALTFIIRFLLQPVVEWVSIQEILQYVLRVLNSLREVRLQSVVNR